MPVYVYQCAECTSKISEEQLDQMTEDEVNQAVLFETYHGMDPSEEELLAATACPRCNSTNCKKSMIGVQVCSYIKGYGWKDRAGARRDMNLYHLQNDDPYSKHRVVGEKDHIERQLKKGGKHDPKSKVFVVSRKTTDG
jgi:predicted nucleic acid-binding Zn ribbon protein